MDFELNPRLIASDEDLAIISAMQFFEEEVLSKIDIDENTTVLEVTKEVNGGKNGLKDRRIHYQNVLDHITDCTQ